MKKIQCAICLNPDNSLTDFYKHAKTGEWCCEECLDLFNFAKTQVHNVRVNNDNTQQQLITSETATSSKKLPNPKEIYNFLNKHIIGQSEAKETVSIAVAHHFRRLQDSSIGKSNILLIGPTGTGKTELARTIAQFLDVPFTTADATTLTSKGFVGDDVESIIQRLLLSAQWDIEKAERGIIFLDEFDKIARRGSNGDLSTSSVNTSAVQQELLRILEGDVIKVMKPNPESRIGFDQINFNTKNILFICAGAFVGLKEIVSSKFTKKSVGIKQTEDQNTFDSTSWNKFLESKHLIQYGIIPELLGRLPIHSVTNELTKEDLKNIIIFPENSISNQYKKLFQLDNVIVDFTDDFYNGVAQEAIDKEIGARGIRSIFENRMKNIFFNITDYTGKKLTIDDQSIKIN